MASVERDDLVTSVNGEVGDVTVSTGGANPVYEAQAAWYIDPANSTGLASDSNSGATALLPLLTFKEHADRLANAILRQVTTVTVLSSQQVGDEPVYSVATTDDTSFTGRLIFVGTLTSIHSGTVTTWSTGAGSNSTDNGDRFVESGIPTSFTASGLLADKVVFVKTGGSKIWWAAADLGSKTLRVSRPSGTFGEAATLTNGDTYTANTFPKILGIRFTSAQAQASIIFRYLEIGPALTYPRPGIVQWEFCWFSTAGYHQPSSWVNCAFGANVLVRGFSGAASAQVIGGMIRNARPTFAGVNDFASYGRITIQGATAGLIATQGTIMQHDGELAVYDTTGIAFESSYYSRVFFYGVTGVGGFVGNTNSGTSAIRNYKWSQTVYLASTLCVAGTFSNGTPIQLGDDNYAVSALPLNQMATYGGGIYQADDSSLTIVRSIVAGTGITVDVTDPEHPIVTGSASGGSAVGWDAESFAWAQSLLPTLNSLSSSDFNDGKANGIATLNTILTAYSGGVYQIGSGGSGNVVLGNTSTQIAIAAPKTEVWAIRVRRRVTGSAFTSSKFIYGIALFDLAANGLAIMGLQSQSSTVWQATHYYNGGATPEYFSCGSVGTLGAATCPVGAFFTIGVTFDATSLRVYFNDTLALTLTGSQLTHMITSPSYLYLGGNDSTIVDAVDGMFVATVKAA